MIKIIDKVNRFMENLLKVLRKNPAECALLITALIISYLDILKLYKNFEQLKYFPILFILLNILNYYKKLRYTYFAVGILFCAFLCFKTNINSTYYFITLIISIVALFSYKIHKDDIKFAENFVKVGSSIMLSVSLSFIVMAILMIISTSCGYLFDIKSYQFDSTILSTVWIGIFPLLFLMFQDNDSLFINDKLFNDKLFAIIFNYIFTPAFIVYGIILYTYFIKITLEWNLPKGNVAVLVLSFSICAYILKLVAPLFSKKYYLFIYKHLSFFIFPILVFFWVGSIYRINEFGFTEARIYLVLSGIFITISCIFFLSQKLGRFIYLAIFFIALFSVFTYIPYISAKDLGVYAQINRFEKSARLLGLEEINSNSRLPVLEVNEQNAKNISTMYESFIYIILKDGIFGKHVGRADYSLVEKRYGISSDKAMREIIGKTNLEMLKNEFLGRTVTFEYNLPENSKIDVSSYKFVSRISGWSTISESNKDEYNFRVNGNELSVRYGNKVIFSANRNDLFLQQMKKAGILQSQTLKDAIKPSEDFFKDLNPSQIVDLFSIDIPEGKIIVNYYEVSKTSEEDFRVYIIPFLIFIK